MTENERKKYLMQLNNALYEPEDFTWKGEIGKKRSLTRLQLFLIFFTATVFFLSTVYLVIYSYQSQHNRKAYDALSDWQEVQVPAPVAVSSGTTQTPITTQPKPLAFTDVKETLLKENMDLVGWIKIDGTVVNYPVVQAADNDFYLRRDFSGEYNKYGIPYLDYEVKLEPKQSVNSTIYGHNMKDGQMFGPVIRYREADFLAAHPVISFETLNGPGLYKVFAVLLIHADQEHGFEKLYTNMDDLQKQEVEALLERVKAESLVPSAFDAEAGDSFITLSTCAYDFSDARLVVLARKQRVGENL